MYGEFASAARIVLADGKVDFAETDRLLGLVGPYARKGDADAVKLENLLKDVRADGVITPDESNVVAGLLELLSARFDDMRGAVPASDLKLQTSDRKLL